MDLKVEFVGICTHDNRSSSETNVVLVNGRNGLDFHGQMIPPHIALLTIPVRYIAEVPLILPGELVELTSPGDDPRRWQMLGVRMEIANPTGGLVHNEFYKRVPSLKTLAAEAGAPNLQLNDQVVRGPGAACQFRVAQGTFDAFRPHELGPIITEVTVDAPSQPQLAFTTLTGGMSFAFTLRGETREPPYFAVSNASSNENIETDADYLLHYLAATSRPMRLVLPPEDNGVPIRNPREIDIVQDIVGSLTLGCSNSVYP